jgi:hypothetical protein
LKRVAAVGQNPPRVVFVVSMRAHFPELYRTAAAMAGGCRIRPVLLFCGDDDYSDECRRCGEADIEAMTVHGSLASDERQVIVNRTVAAATEAPLATLGAVFRVRQALKRWPVAGWLLRLVRDIFVTRISILSFPLHIARMQRLMREAEDILCANRPEAVVLPHIDLGGLSGCMALQAKRQGTPVFVLPYTWIFREEISKPICTKEEYSVRTFVGTCIARRYPHWTYEACLYLPPPRILALEWLGLSTGNPWMADAMADAIAVDSAIMQESYVLDGVERSRCKVTGSASHDILARANADAGRAREILAGLGLAVTEGVPAFALSFLPPDQTGNQMGGFEYASYLDMLRFWIATVTENSELPVVFSLHPRMSPLRGLLLSEFPEMTIYEGDACELIPAATYCAGQFGGMLRFALACAKPVLYFDVYHYQMGSNQFLSAAAVVDVGEKGSFAGAVRRMSGDREYRSSLEQAAGAEAGRWGILDGKAVGRIEDLILEAIPGAIHAPVAREPG